ncbi:hypothetical protein M422DRAFT_254010 [Sphaerobolus stellatus SS14]|uniref:Uncharacterized protein n=1 Tax=Sphaerobolus stellatus (strain SS14) TaxID=990650 RepID=A0A0C9UIP3_SPHS4|nr:hypothetical protein M422DRAFT_254010 [Sphaerobolus stellatus SS14]
MSAPLRFPARFGFSCDLAYNRRRHHPPPLAQRSSDLGRPTQLLATPAHRARSLDFCAFGVGSQDTCPEAICNPPSPPDVPSCSSPARTAALTYLQLLTVASSASTGAPVHLANTDQSAPTASSLDLRFTQGESDETQRATTMPHAASSSPHPSPLSV